MTVYRYYGSARLKEDSVHWGRARRLGRDVAQLLGCTTWSGGGPGMMQAATLGARRTPFTHTLQRASVADLLHSSHTENFHKRLQATY